MTGVTGVLLAFLIVASFAGALIFLLLYVKVSAWRSTAIGRHTFWLSLMIATLTGLAVVSIFLHDYPGRIYVRLGSWAFLTVVLWQRVWLLVKAFQVGPAARHRAAVLAHEEESERLKREDES
jgi:hypothetical protein